MAPGNIQDNSTISPYNKNTYYDINTENKDAEIAPGNISEKISGETFFNIKMILNIFINAFKYLWIAVMAALFVCSACSYLRLKTRLKIYTEYISEYKGIPVYAVKGISSAFVLGFIRPTIYLAENLNTSQREVCLAHEYTHIKRHDHLIKLFAFIIVCIHWFNPLVWLSFKLMTSDMEMSCDENTLRNTGLDRKYYSKTLLSLATNEYPRLSGYPIAFADDNSMSRIKNILNYKNPAVLITAICLIAVIICIVGLSLDPLSDAQNTVQGTAQSTSQGISQSTTKDTAQSTSQDISETYFISGKTVDSTGITITTSDVTESEEQLIAQIISMITAYNELLNNYLTEADLITKELPDSNSKALNDIGDNIESITNSIRNLETILENNDTYMKDHHIYSGTYLMQTTDNKDGTAPAMTIHTYNQSFSIDSSVFSSFYPSGSYAITDDDKMICTTNEHQYKYVFKILDKNKLQFIESESHIPEIIDDDIYLQITDESIFIK